MDGIRTDQAAVSDPALIKRLDIKIPFSPTTSEIHYDLRPFKANYKGLFITGIPRGNDPGRYWFQLRGSLIKAANDGQHNNDGKDPIELLYALDDLVTELRIDPFRTPLNGIESSVTIPVSNSERICRNIVSYVNRPPNYSTIKRDEFRLPYAEVEARHHTLKLYSPTLGKLRVEVNINKMQYLDNSRSYTFSDLVQPYFARIMGKKLLSALSKIIWKCPNLRQTDLTADEWNLYQNGRLWEYWKVNNKDYNNNTEFKRVEKQRSREKKIYEKLVQQHWLSEPPAEIGQRIKQQLCQNMALMDTPLYQTLLIICLNRWQYVGNLPGIIRLPNHRKLPQLSEIYPLYLSKYPTLAYTKSDHTKIYQIGIWDSVENFHYPKSNSSRALPQQKPSGLQAGRRGQKASQTYLKKSMATELYRLRRAVNAPGGLLWSLAELKPILPVSIYLALSQTGQNLSELVIPSVHRPNVAETPIFSSL